MRDLSRPEINKFGINHPIWGTPVNGEGGVYRVNVGAAVGKKNFVNVVASVGLGWDHVSVSKDNRCPTWLEMSFIKDLFFLPTETVMQLHVPNDDHINIHDFCLHLWRPQEGEILLPPKIAV